MELHKNFLDVNRMVSQGMKNAIKILIQNKETNIKKKLILVIEFYTTSGAVIPKIL